MAVNVLKNLILEEVSVVNNPSNDLSQITYYNTKTREMSGIASAEVKDSYGTILDLESMSLDRVRLMYYNHNAYGFPVGTITATGITSFNGKRALRFTGKLLPVVGSHDDPNVVHSYIKRNALNGVSIGFRFSDEGAKVVEVSDEEAENYGNIDGVST